MSTPDDPDEQRDVLSSLPRSRRQRPSARREAARAGRAPKAGRTAVKTAAKAKPKTKAAAKPKPRTTAAKPKTAAAAKPRTTAAAKPKTAAKPRKPRSVIPPAGYATPREHGGHGSADPGAALTDLVRSVLKRLPF